MSFLNFFMFGELLVLLCRRVLVREVKMLAIPYSAVPRHMESLSHSPNDAVVFEKSADTEIFRVFVANLVVLSTPRNPLGFAPVTNAAPEIDAILDAPLFAFVP